MVKKTMLTILKEAAVAEEFNNVQTEYVEYEDDSCDCDDEDLEDISDEDLEQFKNDIIAGYDDANEIDDDDLEYTEEAVTVICPREGEYLVEYENLAKLMKSTGYDAPTAMAAIAECNNISLSDMSVVIESENYMMSLLQEKASTKKSKKKKALAMQSSARFLTDIKNKGIKIVKKRKSKNKRKK